MATFKVVLENKVTYTGYIEATDSQDAVNKVIYPQVLMSNGETTSGHTGIQTDWEVSDNTTEHTITSLTEIGTTPVADIPAAVEPE